MCELLELRGDERVLDVGTGSGYHAAVLARLVAHVWSIELHPGLARRAAQQLAAIGAANVTLLVGDGSLGHPAGAPYDAINVAAASRRSRRRCPISSARAAGSSGRSTTATSGSCCCAAARRRAAARGARARALRAAGQPPARQLAAWLGA